MARQIIQKKVVIQTSGTLIFLRFTADINVHEEALDLWFPDAVISFCVWLKATHKLK
jgi:N6-adenosine-specific RNA methylase IME4